MGVVDGGERSPRGRDFLPLAGGAPLVGMGAGNLMGAVDAKGLAETFGPVMAGSLTPPAVGEVGEAPPATLGLEEAFPGASAAPLDFAPSTAILPEAGGVLLPSAMVRLGMGGQNRLPPIPRSQLNLAAFGLRSTQALQRHSSLPPTSSREYSSLLASVARTSSRILHPWRKD